MDEYSFEAVDVVGQAEEVYKLLRSSVKTKDALLKALKVRVHHNVCGSLDWENGGYVKAGAFA